MATTKNLVTRHDLALALQRLTPEQVAELVGKGATPEGAAAAVESFEKSTRPRKSSTPSKETIRNRAIAADLVDEVTTRGGEFTAAQIAKFATDLEGFGMSVKKVSSLLRQAALAGDLDRVSRKDGYHYAACGYEFAPEVKKPRRKKAKKAEEETPAEEVAPTEE